MNRRFLIFFALLLPAPLLAAAAVGGPAPEFELADQNGQLHSLEDYREQWVVLYFYPRDMTPGCTIEACGFRDDIADYEDANAQILGVSLDTPASHREFAAAHQLEFPLLADVGGRTAIAYGVRTRMSGQIVAKRQTFLINPDGIIVRHYVNVDPARHSRQVLEDLAVLILEREQAVEAATSSSAADKQLAHTAL